MIKQFLIGIIVMAALVMVSGDVAATTLKIATISPDGSFWMQKMREGGDEIAQKTNNRVIIKYYPGGVMGDDKSVLRKIRIGQLHGGAMVSGSLSAFFPDNQIYGLPLIFKSPEEVDYVREHMDSVIMKGLEENGFMICGLAEGGFAYVMSDSQVQTVDDMKKKKVWTPDDNPMVIETLNVMGIRPIPLSLADVRAGLQTGLIDTVATSPIGALALQWHTQVKYLLDIPFIYIYAVLAIDQRAFGQLAPADQEIVRDALGRVFKEIDRQNRIDNVKALDALKNQGIQFIKPSTPALEDWIRVTSDVPERLIKTKQLTEPMMKTLETHLTKFRQQTGNATTTSQK